MQALDVGGSITGELGEAGGGWMGLIEGSDAV